MIAYVNVGDVKVGETVFVELRNSKGKILQVIQVSHVTRVEPSRHHPESMPMDEVEF